MSTQSHFEENPYEPPQVLEPDESRSTYLNSLWLVIIDAMVVAGATGLLAICFWAMAWMYAAWQ